MKVGVKRKSISKKTRMKVYEKMLQTLCLLWL